MWNFGFFDSYNVEENQGWVDDNAFKERLYVDYCIYAGVTLTKQSVKLQPTP